MFGFPAAATCGRTAQGGGITSRRATVLPRLVAAALLAVACSDAVGPERRAPRAPQFAAASSGIVLDQSNGTLSTFPSGTTRIIKGFNPTNPHLGDAIIATFFWLGSTNIIDSVTDHLTDAQSTRVGNTYHLVDYVTAGGVSMATYVATNVQNFPDAGTDPNTTVAVRANLSQSVTEGGVILAAYSGVDGVYPQPAPTHHSNFGAGTGLTVADPGAIGVNAGALAYGVVVSNGVFGSDKPTGFSAIPGTQMSDAALVTDGEYAVAASASTVDPRWTYHYDNASHTWLATVLALNPGAAPPPTGNLTVTTSTTGSSLPSGYTVAVDGGPGQAIGINSSVTFTGLAAGSHTVALSGVPSNCTVSGGTSQTVSVPSGGTANATFNVSCTTPPGSLTVSTSTTGSSLPSGYTVAVDGGPGQAIGINSSVTFTNLTAGSHTVALSGVPSNCTVSGGASRTVAVPSGGTASTTFSVSCITPNQPPVVYAGPNETVVVGLLYTLNWSFSDPDNGPWSYTINWGDGSSSSGSTASPGSFSTGHTYVLPLGTHTVTVTVTDGLGASGSASKTVTVIL